MLKFSPNLNSNTIDNTNHNLTLPLNFTQIVTLTNPPTCVFCILSGILCYFLYFSIFVKATSIIH